jgi:XTP/dITP diphosphohydrolase
MKEILIATHNKGKIREFTQMLEPHGFKVRSAADFDLPEPEETGATFEENALLKAKAAMEATGLPALADDSGLSVDALDGAPGIYSGRWAEKNGTRDFQYAMQRVQDELGDTSNRTARFVAVLALSRPNIDPLFYRGEAVGTLIWPPRGEQGFGYDPMFQPNDETRTFAEMNAEEKHSLSHRAKALKLFLNDIDKIT